METSQKQTSLFTEEKLTSSQGDFLANRTAQQENDSARKMLDTSGRKCLEQYGRLRQHTSWGKTFMGLLIGMGGWSLTRCNLTWKLKGTKSNRLYFQLAVSEHPTKGTESGLLPTVTAMSDAEAKMKSTQQKTGSKHSVGLGSAMVMGLLPTPMACEGHKNMSCSDQKYLSNYARKGLLPTPKATEIEEDYDKWKARMVASGNPKNVGKTTTNLGTMAKSGLPPTPDCSDRRSDKSSQWGLSNFAKNSLLPTPKSQEARGNASKDRGKFNLTDEIASRYNPPGASSQLNPRFVGEMMGFPPNWTELPFLNGETNQ